MAPASLHGPVKVVFFDAAGTLFHVRGSVAEVYLHYAHQYGVRSSPEVKQAIESAFQQAFRDAPPPVFSLDRPDQLKQCERLWWFDVVHAVFYRVGMFEGFDEFFDEVYEGFSDERHWSLYADTLSTLEALKTQGYEVGIISNFDTRLFGILRALSLDRYIDSVTISSLAQAVKPSPKIFRYALAQHVAEPYEAVHVGDSRSEDWEGARGAGLHALLLDRACRVPFEECGPITLQNLAEIPKRLGQITFEGGNPKESLGVMDKTV